MENVLQTISLEYVCENDEINPKFIAQLKEYADRFENVVDDYIDYCIDNHIEMYSASGWLLQLISGLITKDLMIKGMDSYRTNIMKEKSNTQ